MSTLRANRIETISGAEGFNVPDIESVINYKGRGILGRLGEEVYFKDAPFFGKMDGSDDSDAWLRALEYLKQFGGKLNLGAGTLYLKTARTKISMSAGSFKSFTISGEGPGLTHIKFGNISPEFNGAGAVTKKEPNLFDISGVVGLQLAPRVRFEGFSWDYTEQVYKGGASQSTPALTDIVPISNGVFSFMFEFVDGVEIEDVVGIETYGNGIILSRCPHSTIKNVRCYNVSGGNPGAADSSGGFIGIMRGSQVGTLVSHCVGLNTRTYQTDTVAGFNTSTAKNTMCGYIGIWSEYGIETDGKFAPGTDLWGNVQPKNVNSMGLRVEGCFVYGYTLGYKMEGYTPGVFDSCVAINCWIPFIGAGSEGRIVNCYADGGSSDLLVCPQSGYEYVRALFVHYNVSAPIWTYSGFTFDGCMGYTRRMRVNTTNCDNGRFLNQQVVIDHTGTGGDVSIFSTRSSKGMRGAKLSGTYVIKALGEDKSAIIYDMADMDIDVNIINISDKLYTLTAGKYYAQSEGCARSNMKVRYDGLVRPTASQSPGIVMDITGRMINPLFKYRINAISLTSSPDAVIRFDLTLHSTCIPAAANNFGYVSVEGEMPDVTGNITLVDTGQPEVFAVVFSNAIQPSIKLTKTGDTYSLPMIITGTTARGMHLRGIRTNDDTSPVFDIRYTLQGPISYEAGTINAGRFSLQGMAYEPNHPDRLNTDRIHYMPGIEFKYLRPVLGGKSGCRVHVGGTRAAPWVASTAVALNAFRATDSQVYQATVAGTTGTVAPTHTTGTAVDGTVTWTWFGPRARFVETSDTSSVLI